MQSLNANVVLGVVTTALGLFVMISPERSARVWGPKNVGKLSPSASIWYLRGFRVLGILLCLAGVLVTLESIMFPG